MREHTQYCPVARASEVLGDRWNLLIVREMLLGATGFNELQRGLPGISRSVLADRLKRLERAEVTERRTGPAGRTTGYRLTANGRDLKAVVFALGEWGATWMLGEPRPGELDPDLVMIWMARGVNRSALPAGRTVVQFDLADAGKRYWMVLDPAEVSVCLQHPGFDVDLHVAGDTPTMYAIYQRRLEVGAAMNAGTLAMRGPSDLQRAFPSWCAGSKFASAIAAAGSRRTAAQGLADPDHVLIVD
jgi:DNA-binding HxlR family transcriptional regulator